MCLNIYKIKFDFVVKIKLKKCNCYKPLAKAKLPNPKIKAWKEIIDKSSPSMIMCFAFLFMLKDTCATVCASPWSGITYMFFFNCWKTKSKQMIYLFFFSSNKKQAKGAIKMVRRYMPCNILEQAGLICYQILNGSLL